MSSSYLHPATRLATPVPGYAATIWAAASGEHLLLAVGSAEGGQQLQIPATEAGLKRLMQILRARAAGARARAQAPPAQGLELWKQQREQHKQFHCGGAVVASCLFCKGEARDARMRARAVAEGGSGGVVSSSKKLGTGPDTVIVRRVTPPGKNYSQQYSMEELGL